MRLFFLIGDGRDLATMYHRYLSSDNNISECVIVVQMGNRVLDQCQETSTHSLSLSHLIAVLKGEVFGRECSFSPDWK